MTEPEVPPNPAHKPGYSLEFHDEFDAPRLDPSLWIDAHLPQWASSDSARARHELGDSLLTLKIDVDQPPWCPEYDGEIRVSSLQTGVFSGSIGSTQGQHRFNRASVVREAQVNRITYAPIYGYFELRAKVAINSGNHAALWMIGYEDEPERSSEICIFEIFGNKADASSCRINYGVHPFGDARIRDEFHEAELAIDVSRFHLYAAEWRPTEIEFFVDNRSIGVVAQSPAYPMQFMLGLYERPAELRGAGDYPKRFVVDYFRGYRRS